VSRDTTLAEAKDCPFKYHVRLQDRRLPLRYRPRVRSPLPRIDDGVRRRLTARFGAEVGAWFDELPAVLSALAERWQVEFDSVIPRGSMSVVIRCRMTDGRPAVLKVGPDRTRIANEAAALDRWTSVHTPTVLAVDESAGALLIEAIEPGTPLVDSPTYPDIESVAELLTSLHATGVPDPSYPPLAHHVAYLFDSGTRPYKRRPDLVDVVPPELYERGRQLATRLVERVSPTALLHGDLTPNNILDGGNQRGLVAIDPAPCLGDDLAFEAVDLLLWQAGDVDMVAARAEKLAPAIGVDARRLLDWCTAFAGMVALELAEAPNTPRERIEAAVTLANQAPTR
jgi:streptomycin 6-kinase